MNNLPSHHLAEAVRLLRASGHKNAGQFGIEAEMSELADKVALLVTVAECLERERKEVTCG